MPPKDQRLIDFGFRFARGLIDGSIVSLGLSLAFRQLIEQKDEKKLAQKLTNKSFSNEEKNEIKRNGLSVQDIKDEIDNQKTLLEDRENPDKQATQEAIRAREEAEKKTKEAEEKARDAIISGKASEIAQTARSEAERELIIEEAEKTRRRALEEGKKQGESEQGRRLEKKLDALSDNMKKIKKKVTSFKKGKYKTREIKEYKIQDEQQRDGKIGGLGLSSNQRNELKSIIKKEAGDEYANAIDLISGDDIKAGDLLNGLIGIALSAVVPIPAPIIARISNVLMTSLGVDINDYFDQITVGEGVNEDIILLSTREKIEEAEVTQVNPFARYNNVEQEVADQMEEDRKAIAPPKPAQIEPPKKSRKKRMVNAVQTGAVVGMAAGGIVGGPIATVMGLSAGAAIGAGTELVSRTELPRIAGQITQRIADATPRLPTVEGVRRGVRRAITTDRKDVSIPIPRLSTRGVSNQEMAVFNNRIVELNNEYDDLRRRQRRINDDMMANVDMGVSNTRLGLTEVARQISQAIRENRDSVLEIEYQIGRGPRPRLDIDRKDIEIPVLRRTTDEEKALVPFDEEKEKMSKEKSLAVMGAAGSAVALAGAYKMKDNISQFWREEPVQLPGDVLTEQQDKIKQITGKGLLRPKFIIPNVNILQPSDQELAADALEFAAFDFVRPNTEGGEGDLNTNILKRSQKLNENIRFNGAGVQINSLFGYDLPVQPSQETINNLFLYKALPPLKFQEQEYNLSEFEVMSYDPINQRGAVEMFSPYNDFSDNIPDDRNEMDMSVLFSIVP